jgi:hypothetical protein
MPEKSLRRDGAGRMGLRAAGPHDNENFMGRIIPAFLLLILSACVGVAPNVEGVRTIGIVSAIGDKLYLRKVGITAFGNDSQEFAIDSWGIDDLMIAKIRAALAPRFDVRPVTYRRAVFAAFPDRTGILAQYFRPDLVRTEVSPQGLDAYLVVLKSERQYGRTNQILQGLGTVEGNSLFGSIIYVHAYYDIVVVDRHDFKTKSQTISTIPGQQKFGDLMGSPYRQVDASWWPSSRDAASNQRLKGVVVELIDQSLPGTLQRMQLVQ